MKRRQAAAWVVMGLQAACGGSARAQIPEKDAAALAAGYVAALNSGDMARLAGLYAVPGVSLEAMAKRLQDRLAEIRDDAFGHVELYGTKVCAADARMAKLELHYDLALTFGGVMAPGDRRVVLPLARDSAGWRIIDDVDLMRAAQPLSSCT